jgi:Serine carboxypeptidase S28
MYSQLGCVHSFSLLVSLLLFLFTPQDVVTFGLHAGILHDYDLMDSLGLLPDEGLIDRGASRSLQFLERLRPKFVTLKLDHFDDASTATFNNRYWVDEKYYQPGGPIFIFDVGEADAMGPAMDYFLKPAGGELAFFQQLVKQFNGMGILWEHRFYGNSSPIAVSETSSAKDFEFLTVKQALADIPAFAWSFRRENFANIDLTPAGAPWVFVGGSYPG